MKNCPNCNAALDDNATFCTSCGKALTNAAATATTSVTPSTVLTWGILGLVFASTGILGLIFSIIGRKKFKAYLAEGGEAVGQAKVGGILAKVGLILSIVMIVVWAIYIIAAIVAASAISSIYSSLY